MMEDKIEYEGEDYRAALELSEYQGKQAAFIHLDVLKNTPRVMRKIENDLVTLMAMMDEIGVELFLTMCRADEPKTLKFQMRWGFKPWVVHETVHGDYIVSKQEGY